MHPVEKMMGTCKKLPEVDIASSSGVGEWVVFFSWWRSLSSNHQHLTTSEFSLRRHTKRPIGPICLCRWLRSWRWEANNCWMEEDCWNDKIRGKCTPTKLKSQFAPESHDGWKKKALLSFLGWQIFRGQLLNFQGVSSSLDRLVAGTSGEMEEVAFLKKSFN